eukprot:15454992-Alexandrium_andersonii.AAC.1
MAGLAARFVAAAWAEDDSHLVRAAGSEKPVVNELVLSRGWSTVQFWRWPAPGHINFLGTKAYRRWLRRLARQGGRRDAVLQDSRVALCSQAKGQ